jgi:diguanylate cyclase (GGDEF)-like protein/PAS domain S-box-containing protein
LRNSGGEYETFELVGQVTGGGALGRSVVVTARNINERRKAKELFYAAAERLRVTFEHAPLGVSLVSLEGRILDINAAACHMSGKSREELLGSDAQELLHPDDRALTIETTTRQLAGEEVMAEFRMLRPDGSIVWALSEARLYEPPKGDPFIITMQTDITERKRLEVELAIQATRDPLTGLLNRGAFVTQLELELARRDPPSFALLFIDLDKFKPVNDKLGHGAGDAVLAQVADRLEKHTRRGDVVARLGGDEFVVIYHGRDIKQGVTYAAERLCAAVAEPIEIHGQQVSVGASVGAAIARVNESAAELMQRADEASYRAKKSGGSCVVYADPVDVRATATRRSSA